MATYTYQQIGITGPAITPVTPTAFDFVAPHDRGFLLYENTNAATRDIVVVVPGQKYGQDRTDVTRTIAATTGRALIGPLVADLADPVTGLITIAHSATAGLTVAACVL